MVAKKKHGKPLSSVRYPVIDKLTPYQLQKVVDELSSYATFDTLVRIKGQGDTVLEFSGDGLDSIDVNALPLQEWRDLYGRDSDERP